MDDYQTMQHQQVLIEHGRQREEEFLMEIQNLTEALVEKSQREELHARQVDVLTERIMEVEATAAMEHNMLLEQQANCTLLEGQVEEWERKCNDLEEQTNELNSQLSDMRIKCDKASREAEDLAIRVEKHRLSTKGEIPHLGGRGRRKKRGFWEWLFGKLFGFGHDGDDGDGDASAYDWDKLHDTARSTLIEALQTERNTVEQLESMVNGLQENNSAIAEQVQSRDMIVDELNDRVAVFESDKVVLKAALKQLQQEMNEEAPKTQQLADELAKAHEEVDKLHAEMDDLCSKHKQTVLGLEENLAEKQASIVATESNLTAIGTYVDKLEERLADFMVARRDIESREKEYDHLVRTADEAKSERDATKEKVALYEKEHRDLKELLEELVKERTSLSEENVRLAQERENFHREEEAARQASIEHEDEVNELKRVAGAWNDKVKDLEEQLKASELSKAVAESKIQGYEEMQQQLEDSQTRQRELSDALSRANATRASLQEQVVRQRKEEEGEEAGTRKTPKAKGNSNNSKRSYKSSGGRRKRPPLRKVRKWFAKSTGFRGVFTEPSSKLLDRTRPPSPSSIPPPPPRRNDASTKNNNGERSTTTLLEAAGFPSEEEEED